MAALGGILWLMAGPTAVATPNTSDTALTTEARNFLQQGQTFARDGQWQAAIALYKNALDINPRLADAHFLLGVAYYQDEETGSAVSALRRAGELNPRSAKTFYNLGVAYAQTGDTTKEMAAYREALRLNPDHISAHYNLGTAYWAQGKDDLACAKLYRAG
ncbi:tetratricopeptide repeat protein, partial [Thiohalorhabdus sp.]|uniref:tetratricopeptide repeat protein n=1 Tax=Thiohalorhabdus sp. TaxID=3094134 RepID=UPI002FC2B69F